MSEYATSSPDLKLRPVRSFVRREGRATAAQKQALQTLWPKYGFAHSGQRLDQAALFGRTAPLVLEIGYGDGEALIAAAQHQPGIDYIGAEVYSPGIGHCLLRIEEQQLRNVRLCREDAVELLKSGIADASLTEIRLFFPDPWPKKKHHKRRIINESFIALISRKLTPGGRIHFATDWAPYAEWALAHFEAAPQLENVAGEGCYITRPASRIETRFERRGKRLGQASRDLIYRRKGKGEKGDGTLAREKGDGTLARVPSPFSPFFPFFPLRRA